MPGTSDVFSACVLFLVACGANGQTFPVVPGRSGPELGAAIFQLENFLAKNEEFNNTYVAQKPALFSEDPDLLPPQSILSLRPTGIWMQRG